MARRAACSFRPARLSAIARHSSSAQAAIDSGWTLEVKHFTVSRLRAKIRPLGGSDDDGDDDHDGDR
jgi:hypothetical protein